MEGLSDNLILNLNLVCIPLQTSSYISEIPRQSGSVKGFRNQGREGFITGSATESEVASKATARVIMQRLMNEA